MKKLFTIILTIAFCLSMAACGSSKRIASVDNMLNEYQANSTVAYKFFGEYSKQEKTYTIFMQIDEERLYEIYKDCDASELETYIMLGKVAMDIHTDRIESELETLKKSAVKLLDGTNITVVTKYIDRNGNVVTVN